MLIFFYSILIKNKNLRFLNFGWMLLSFRMKKNQFFSNKMNNNNYYNYYYNDVKATLK